MIKCNIEYEQVRQSRNYLLRNLHSFGMFFFFQNRNGQRINIFAITDLNYTYTISYQLNLGTMRILINLKERKSISYIANNQFTVK